MSTQHGFWISATDNRVFDGIVTRHLATHGTIIASHAFCWDRWTSNGCASIAGLFSQGSSRMHAPACRDGSS